jgi:1-acyl-sn-glycerol-3-phosphate acyltransferase
MTNFLRTSRRLANLAVAVSLARLGPKGSSDPAARTVWQQRQARRMLAALEIEISVKGHLPRGGLLVCNHLGYLDVLVIAAQGPVVFVAKSDVRKWPVIGTLLERSGTILAERGRPLTAGTTAGHIQTALEEGLTVVLFPEGTSSDGSSVLPYKPALLQAALDAGVAVTPAAIAYQADDGNAARDVCYWGDATFLPHLVRLAGLKKVKANLNIGSARILPPNRKIAASQLHEDSAALLANLTD